MQHRETAGTGLFDNLAFNARLSYELEQKIITMLDIKAIIFCSCLNKIPWNRRMTEEIKRRKGCVTIYTWSAAETSSERVQGRMGHSALKTYGGSDDGRGVYVSFYPGDCDRNNRHPSCRKSISHFHRWNQESRNEATIIDLYGLDVDAINQAFHGMHDANMRSIKSWSARHNCSDMVLFLLEKGNIFNQIDFRRYGYKTLFTTGMLVSTFAPVFVNSLYDLYAKTPRLMFQTLADDFYELFGISLLIHNGGWSFTANGYRCLAHILFDAVIGGLTSALIAYSYSTLSSLKLRLPINRIRKQAFQDGVKISIISFSYVILAFYVRELFGFLGYEKLRVKNFPNSISIIHLESQPLLTKILKRILPKIASLHYGYPTNQAYIITIGSLILLPTFLITLSSLFYNTTTTPKHVLNVSRIAKNKFDAIKNEVNKTNRFMKTYGLFKTNISQSVPSIICETWNNKFKILGSVVCVTVGFFVYKNRGNLDVLSKSLNSSIKFKCTY